MEVIPVIDLKDGLVVRARHGDRASYRPIETPLSPSSEPLDVVAGLLSVHPFRTLYIADLDAIENSGDSTTMIEQIAERFPQLALWLDNGCAELFRAQDILRRFPCASLVLGSESQPDTSLASALHFDERTILSLDFRGDEFLGPPELLRDASLWPARLILMTLARVGSGAGPDFDRMQDIIPKAADRAVYLAGGLRGREDLPPLRASGAAGILVASAIHDGRLAAADLAAMDP